jgi:glc operon protein GlcG
MFKITALLVTAMTLISGTLGADLPVKKTLNLAAIKTMAAAAEAEALKRNVQVTICIVDESGNLLYLQKGDGAGLNTIQFAQKKARHSAFYKQPSKAGADQLKGGDLQVLAFPDFFPNQGGCRFRWTARRLEGSASAARHRKWMRRSGTWRWRRWAKVGRQLLVR